MNYKSISDLNRDILEWIPNLPRNIDVIAGIPRSGLLAANILGLHLNKPITDIGRLIEGKVLSSGERLSNNENIISVNSRILILDDSVNSGRQMIKTKEKIESQNLDYDILYGSVYIKPDSLEFVDVYAKKLEVPRIFEWNLFHHGYINDACVDIDGVLCRDPTEEENDDAERYEKFIENVQPNIIPSRRIGWLVTCRLEKYRPQTEKWLQDNGIKYDHLIMMDYESKEERVKAGNHGIFKAKVYSNTVDARLFIESSPNQASVIAQKAGKPVIYWPDQGGRVLNPGEIKSLSVKMKKIFIIFFNSPITFLHKLIKFLKRK